PISLTLLDSLPPGLTFVGSQITGTPIQTGMFLINIKASNSSGETTEPLTIVIYDPAKNTFPYFVSPPTLSANPVIVGTPVTFTAVANDKDGDVLGYYWNFGDGSDGVRFSETSHVFANPGRYDVTISVSDGKHLIG